MSFPRFYFLSNDELLDILANSKNPESVQVTALSSRTRYYPRAHSVRAYCVTNVSSALQPHLVKCFENVRHVLLWKQGVGPPSVKMLISAEGEGLVLPKYERCLDCRPLSQPPCFEVSTFHTDLPSILLLQS